MSVFLLKNGSGFEVHSAPERGYRASIWAGHFTAIGGDE
jgi:hypothetical protein